MDNKINISMHFRDAIHHYIKLLKEGNVQEAEDIFAVIESRWYNLHTRIDNAESNQESLQFELQEVRRYQEHMLPFDYKAFNTIYDAVGELCGERRELLLDDEILVQDGDIFWKCAYKGEDLDDGGVQWYTAIGQKVKAKDHPPYLVIKDFKGQDSFD